MRRGVYGSAVHYQINILFLLITLSSARIVIPQELSSPTEVGL
jgi:hypothetical protein